MIYIDLLMISIFWIVVILYVLSLCNQIIYKVPHVSTFNSDLHIIKEVFSKYISIWNKVADLWSGTWKIVRLLEKDFWAKVTWYEIDLSNVLISKIVNTFKKYDAKIVKWNYLKTDLKNYDVLYIYLFPCLMEKVEERIFSHCTKWTIVIVNAFPLKNKKPIDVFLKNWKEKIFVYRV